MLNAIKRLFGGGNKRTWLDSQRDNLRRYLAQELGSADGLQEDPVWTFEPYVALWTIPDGWAITDPVVAYHVTGRNNVLQSVRDAARYFGRHFRATGENARRDRKGEIAEMFTGRATALLGSVDQDTGWPKASVAVDAEALLTFRNCLMEAESDIQFRRAVRVIREEVTAPSGPFHAVYFFLDLQPGQQLAVAFDALARHFAVFESRFAPMVAWRVTYALVVLGVNFGDPGLEMEVERQADQMRIRNRELSEALDRYSSKGTYPLAMHFVDNKDVPFTAHPVLGARPAGYRYKAEEKFFDVRTHPFHKSLEESEAVGMRMIAGSIAPEVIQKARRAFA